MQYTGWLYDQTKTDMKGAEYVPRTPLCLIELF
jgi:hypothetical protein